MIKSSVSSTRRSQSRRILRAAVMSSPAVLAALSFAPQAGAASLYWDVNGTAAGGASTTTAAGTWNAANSNWNVNADGTGSPGTWAGAGNVATFSAGTGVTGAYSVTVSGTQTLDGITYEEGSAVTLTGGALNFAGTNGSISLNGVGTHVIASDIQGTNGWTRILSGTTTTSQSAILSLTGAKTYTGQTALNAGTTRISNSAGLGVADNSVANAVIMGISAAPKLELSGGISVNKLLALTNWGADNLGQIQATSGTNTWAGDIHVSGQVNNFGAGVATIGASSGATLVVTGEIKDNTAFSIAGSANTNAFAKEGPGTVVLRHANLNHTGLTRVFDGVLQVEADGALGQGVVYTPNVGLQRGTFIASLSGKFGTVSFANNVNYLTSERIQSSGSTGTGGRGFLDGGVGNNTYGGDVAMSGSNPLLQEISVNGANDSLTLSGKLYQTGTGTARHIHKLGAGTLIITGHNDLTDGFILSTTSQNSTNDQYHMQDGEINVDGGNLVLKDGLDRLGNPTSGALATTVPIFVNLGATFTLDNSAGVSTTRLANTTALTLSAGEVKLIGNASTSVNQPAGALSVASFSTISVNQPANTNGATTTFSLGTLTRSARGTALLRGMDNTTSFIGLAGTLKGGGGSAGSPTISILTEVVGDTSPTGIGSDFITIDGGFARTLTAGEYTPLVSGNATLVNTTVTGNTTVSSDTTVNAIKLSGGNTVTINTGKKLLVSSGGLLGVGAGTSTITGGELTFQDATLFSDPDTGQTSFIVNSVNEGIVTVPTGSTLSIASNVSGSEGLTKSGQGLLILGGNNTFGTDNDTVKGVTINAGTLQFGTDSNLGSPMAPIILNGGTLNPTSTSTSSRTISLASPGTNTINVGTGGSFTVTGNVSGRALIKSGGGTLALTNTGNGYTGGTTIQAGDMLLDAVNPLQPTFGTGGITLAGGSITVPTGTVSMVLDKSLVSATGNTSTTGGFIIPVGSTLIYGSGPTSTVGMSGSGNYAINGGGTLILSHNVGTQMSYTGRLIVNNASTLVFENNGGTNNIAGIGGTAIQSTQWVVLNGGSRLKFNISSTGGGDFGGTNRGITVNGAGTIDITGTNTLNTFGIMTTDASSTFTKDGAGLLSLRADNSATFLGKWVVANGILEIGNAGGNGKALGASTASDAVTLQAGTTLQGTTTTTTGTVLGGVVLAGSATLGAKTTTTLTFSNNVSGPGNLTVNSGTLGGTVQFSGASNSYTGSTNVAGGKLQLLSNVTSTSSVSVATGATLQLTSSGPSNFQRVLKTGSVSTAGTGKINIDNNKMILTAQSVGTWNGSAYTDATGLIAAGYSVNQDFSGNGIVTTQTAASGGSTLTNIGIVNNADIGYTTFGGVSVGAGDTLIMYTYNGDANLDGVVNGDDYFQIDSAFPQGASGWFNGDFNYDGVINGDDYFVIDSTFPQQGAAIPTSSGIAGGSGLAGVTAVPEPASIAVLGLGAVSLLARRSRRKS